MIVRCVYEIFKHWIQQSLLFQLTLFWFLFTSLFKHLNNRRMHHPSTNPFLPDGSNQKAPFFPHHMNPQQMFADSRSSSTVSMPTAGTPGPSNSWILNYFHRSQAFGSLTNLRGQSLHFRFKPLYSSLCSCITSLNISSQFYPEYNQIWIKTNAKSH